MPLKYPISNKTQGNIRLSYTWDTQHHQVKTLEENHYYPFGLQHHAYSPFIRSIHLRQTTEKVIRQIPPEAAVYKYKYQGQERQDDPDSYRENLNWDSFKYRNYDYAIGRFMSIDPLAEKYPYNSTYAFQENKMGLGRELEGLELEYRDNIGVLHQGPFNMNNVPDDWQEVKTNSEGWSEKLDAVEITVSSHKNETSSLSTNNENVLYQLNATEEKHSCIEGCHNLNINYNNDINFSYIKEGVNNINIAYNIFDVIIPNKYSNTIGTGLAVISIGSDYYSSSNNNIFIQNTVQTVASTTASYQHPILGISTNIILNDGRANDGLTNLKNGRMANAYRSNFTQLTNYHSRYFSNSRVDSLTPSVGDLFNFFYNKVTNNGN